jgi:hypothetical protein
MCNKLVYSCPCSCSHYSYEYKKPQYCRFDGQKLFYTKNKIEFTVFLVIYVLKLICPDHLDKFSLEAVKVTLSLNFDIFE